MNTIEARLRLKTILTNEGVRAAIIFLNGLTSHRFTALYQFEGDILQNLHFFDREHPEVESSDETPVLASYCVFVRDHSRMFETSDSLQDERVRDHPKRKLIQSYCGVPLLDEDGTMFGTMCHFDFLPKQISDVNVELMEAFALLLKQHDRLARHLVG